MRLRRATFSILLPLAGVACQALLGADPSPGGGAHADASIDGGGPDGTASPTDGGDDAKYDGGSFCLGMPVRDASYCEDFDGPDSGHLKFAVRPPEHGTATIDSKAFWSPPRSLVVDIPGPLDTEIATASEAFDFVGQEVACEFEWRVEQRPAVRTQTADNNADLLTIVLNDDHGNQRTYGLFEWADGEVAAYVNGPTPKVADPRTGWAHASFTLSASALNVTIDETVSAPLSVDRLSTVTDAHVYIGAHSTRSWPWTVRFDNLYCEVH